MTAAITIHELLKDPQYREYFLKVPKLPEHYSQSQLPWKLMIKKRGELKWRTKRFATYKEAFEGLKQLLDVCEDAVINCPSLAFDPPFKTYVVKGKLDKKGYPLKKSRVWKPKLDADMDQHFWCGHCRRPTVFAYRAMGARRVGSYVMPPGDTQFRCLICASSDRVTDIREPMRNQQWDMNRAKFYA